MLVINRAGYSLPPRSMQGNRAESKPQLKSLSRDTFSFRGGLFKTLFGKTEYVSKETCDAVSKFAQENKGTGAGHFMGYIHKICTNGTNEPLMMDAEMSIKEVEPKHVETVSKLLKQIHNSTAKDECTGIKCSVKLFDRMIHGEDVYKT